MTYFPSLFIKKIRSRKFNQHQKCFDRNVKLALAGKLREPIVLLNFNKRTQRLYNYRNSLVPMFEYSNSVVKKVHEINKSLKGRNQICLDNILVIGSTESIAAIQTQLLSNHRELNFAVKLNHLYVVSKFEVINGNKYVGYNKFVVVTFPHEHPLEPLYVKVFKIEG